MDTNTRDMGVMQESKPDLFSRRNVAIGCTVLAVIAVCVCIFACAGFLIYYGREPQDLTIDHSIPYQVTRGEEFELVLTLTNTGDTDIYIGDIDLDEALGGSILDGAITLSTDPEMERDFSLSGIKTFKYNRTIPAGATRVVVFRLQAVSVGEYGGSVGAYVGDLAARIDYVGITIVED
jgi:hypothetical protein